MRHGNGTGRRLGTLLDPESPCGRGSHNNRWPGRVLRTWAWFEPKFQKKPRILSGIQGLNYRA